MNSSSSATSHLLSEQVAPQPTVTVTSAAYPVATTANVLPVVGNGAEINTFENKKSCHVRSLVLSILTWVSLVLFVVAVVENQAFFDDGSVLPNTTYHGLNYASSSNFNYYRNYYYYYYHYHHGYDEGTCGEYSSPFLCGASYSFPILISLYLLESFVFVCDCCVKCKMGSSTCRYTCNIKSDSSSERFIAQLHSTNPQFRMHVECYHYETRSRQVSYTDSNGNTRYKTEYYKEKVVTHRATDWIRYEHWLDNSTSVCGLGIHPMVKMEFSKSYQYADAETAREFDRQRAVFRSVHNRDVYQDYHESYIINGYEQYALCCRHGEKPAMLGIGGYFFATIFLLTWPYRRWLELMCLFTRIRIRKIVSCQAPLPQLLPLVAVFGQARDLVLTEAIVYQQMYSAPMPNIPMAVQTQVSQAIAVEIPTATFVGKEILDTN